MAKKPSAEGAQDYPEVGFLVVDDPKRRVVDHVFGSLLALNIDQAVNAIERGENSGTAKDADPEIAVTTRDDDQGSPMLEFTYMEGDWYAVYVDPAKFDRSNNTHDRIFTRCQRLVKALNDAQSSVATGADYDHPQLGRFQFWVSKESESDQTSAQAWAVVAAQWGVE
jgi:hypothetical protein